MKATEEVGSETERLSSLTAAALSTIEKCELTIRSEVDGLTHVIQLFGELDLSSAASLEGELLRVEGTQAAQIIVDLSGLHFIDTAGCEALLEAAQRSRSTGRRLGVLRGSGQVQRVLHVVEPCRDLPFLD
jgi:anti-anti-sigma factor